MPLTPDQARAIAAQRPRASRLCACGCGRAFTATTRGRYYSHACRQRAYRERHGQREPGPVREVGRPRKTALENNVDGSV